MVKLSDNLANGKVINKDKAVVERDFNGKIKSISKIEYVGEIEYLNTLKEIDKEKEREDIAIKEEKKAQEEIKVIKSKIEYKQRVLSAFDRFYRDMTSGIVDYDGELYTEILNWYREYLKDDTIAVHEELKRYL